MKGAQNASECYRKRYGGSPNTCRASLQRRHQAGKVFQKDTEVFVTLSIEKSRHICEVTVPLRRGSPPDGGSLGDMYNSIDASLKKLERQIRRHRTKLEKRLHERLMTMLSPFFMKKRGRGRAGSPAGSPQKVRRQTHEPGGGGNAEMELLGAASSSMWMRIPRR